MTDEQWDITRPLLVESCGSLFAGADALVTYRREARSAKLFQRGIAVFVALTSAQIRGSLGLVLPLAVLSGSHPMRLNRTLGEAELRDWAREIGNLLGGRLKNRLIELGVSVRISPPHEVLGTELPMPDVALDPHRVLEFTSSGIAFYVQLAAQITNGTQLRAAAIDPHSREKDAKDGQPAKDGLKAAKEGDVVIF